MLNDSYALGEGGSALTYVKRFGDIDKSQFSVAGLATNAARTMTVSHQASGDGTQRTVVSLDETDVNPADTTGRTSQSRLYIVMQRSSFKSAADVKKMFERLVSLIDSEAFQDKILNREV